MLGSRVRCRALGALVAAGATLFAFSAQAQIFSVGPDPFNLDSMFQQPTPPRQLAPPQQITPAQPAESPDEAADARPDDSALAPRLRRQIVAYPTREAPGTIVIDTVHTYLYYVTGGNRAIRYGIGVGREGFTWSGVTTIERKAEWPDWIPPAEMIDRQPYLPRWMAGGPGNPLGARAMYLRDTLYRIHGTNDSRSIGKHVSSGCIRMLNADVIDLYDRASVGTKVVVLPQHGVPVAVNDVTRTATRAITEGGSAAD